MAAPIDPAAALSELARIKLGENDLHAVLHRVAELAKGTLPRVEDVSVTLVQGERAHTAAHTGALALRLDQAQYDSGFGPCLEAARGAETVRIADYTTELRWPFFVAAAREAGVASSLSVGLPIQENVVGALNIYCQVTGVFDEPAVELAETFAAHAAVALANAHLYENTATLADHMQQAMHSRAVIEQAKGILMAERGCTPQEAFEMLTKMSQHSNRKVHEISVALVEKAQRKVDVD